MACASCGLLCSSRVRSVGNHHPLIHPTGLIIAASVLVAAGIAVYEHPQVQEWMEKTRRKIVIALQNLGDEARPAGPTPEEIRAAVEAARRKRDEVLSQNPELFVRRPMKQHGPSRTRSMTSLQKGCVNFDDFLAGDGNGAYTLHNSSAQPAVTNQTVRRRKLDDEGRTSADNAMGPAVMPASQILFDVSTVGTKNMEKKNDGSVREHLAIAADEHSMHDSQPLIQIDSRPDSPFSSVEAATPSSASSSSTKSGLSNRIDTELSPQATSTYFSINEWAESTSNSVYGPPPPPTAAAATTTTSTSSPDDNPVGVNSANTAPTTTSTHGAEEAEEAEEDDMSDLAADAQDSDAGYPDILSDTSGMHTPATWTEVGSEVSDGDVGSQ